MGDTTTLVLHYDRSRLDAIRRDGQIWLRVRQIDAPLGLPEKGVRKVYERHADEFTSDETMLIVEQTAGGPQQVRVFSLRGARLLAMFARTEPAARFRRWLLDVLEGKAAIGARPSGDLLERVEGTPPLRDQPMVQAAIAKSIEAGRDVAQAFRDARAKQKEARRLAAMAGLSPRELKILVERERWLAQRPSHQSPLFDA